MFSIFVLFFGFGFLFFRSYFRRTWEDHWKGRTLGCSSVLWTGKDNLDGYFPSEKKRQKLIYSILFSFHTGYFFTSFVCMCTHVGVCGLCGLCGLRLRFAGGLVNCSVSESEQSKLEPEHIEKLGEVLDIPAVQISNELGAHWWPNRGLGSSIPTDPVIYRFYEVRLCVV